MKASYRERDYTYGATMLTLRTAIGLTQDGLAKRLGVSRRAVGEWEGGSSYPKAEHLKELIALAVKQQAFASGNEAEAIRALWKATRQKMLLDEGWLASLLKYSRSPHLHLVPKPDKASKESRALGQHSSGVAAFAPRTLVDWGDALSVLAFYGREEELAQLSQWIVQERARVVSVLGMGGIGKSALATNLMYQQAEHFEVVIFRSLSSAPAFEALLDDCLQVLSPESLGRVPSDLESRLSDLVSHLRERRVLLVLDNLECLFEAGDPPGHFRPGFPGYGRFLRRLAETAHQSCLLVTSRETPADLRALSGKHAPVRSLPLSGLDLPAGIQLLAEKELVGTEAEKARLIEAYSGNPLALKMVAEMIFDLFGGEIAEFLATGTLVTGPITNWLSVQCACLSRQTLRVLSFLASVSEPVTLHDLLAIISGPAALVLEAIDALHRRGLIEQGSHQGSFILPSVMKEYVTTILSIEGKQDHLTITGIT